jgi:group I intron endonuclease
MPNYQNRKVYKIVNDVNGDIYIGSSCSPLWKRWGQHKLKCLQCPNRKLYTLMNELGNQHFRIVLIENYACNSKDELTAREQIFIDQMKPTLNANNSHGLNIQKRKAKHKITTKLYRTKNADKIREQQNQRYVCDCGSEYVYGHKTRHLNTLKHLNYLRSDEYIPNAPLF